MKKDDQYTILIIIIFGIVLIYYGITGFITNHPYWSILSGIILLGLIILLIKYTIQYREIREMETSFLQFVWDFIKKILK